MKTLAELAAIRENLKNTVAQRDDNSNSTRIVVGMATCGIAAGARPVLQALAEEVAKRGLPNVVVTQTGCIGICRLEPVIEVYKPGKEKVTYVQMDAEKAVRVVNDHIVNNNVIIEYTVGANT